MQTACREYTQLRDLKTSDREGGFVRLRSVDAHHQQTGLECC